MSPTRNSPWFKITLQILLVALIAWTAMSFVQPASANVTTLILGRRNCESVVAYVLYDGGSVGAPPYLSAFTIDLNGNGVFGEAEAMERTVFTKTGPNGAAGYVKGTLKFPAVPEGTTIAVTAYELDSEGRTISGQLSPVRFTCTNRVQTNQIPADAPFIIPSVAVTVKVTATNSIPVWSAPNGQQKVGGLAPGAILSAVGRNSRGDWLQVVFGGSTAWVMWNTNALVFGPYKSLPVTAQ